MLSQTYFHPLQHDPVVVVVEIVVVVALVALVAAAAAAAAVAAAATIAAWIESEQTSKLTPSAGCRRGREAAAPVL